MQNISIRSCAPSGKSDRVTLAVPPSKSHTLRAIWFASMSEGTSIIHNVLDSPDTDSMITACKLFSATIVRNENTLHIKGFAGKPKTPQLSIDCGNSGQVLRFCSAMAALCDGPVSFDGDESIRQRRPMQAVIDGINQLGGNATSQNNNGLAPLTIQGACHAGKAAVSGQFAQPVSSLILLATQLEGTTTINAAPLTEPSWVALTLYWLDKLGLYYTELSEGHYKIQGQQTIKAFETTIPGDFSSAAFPLIASIIHSRPITLTGLDFNDPQGDKQLFDLLETIGIPLQKDHAKQQLTYLGDGKINGGRYDIQDFNDAIAILTVLACFANDTVTITGASNTQHKESNRLQAIADGLNNMAADIKVTADGLIIEPSLLQSATVNSQHDHRIAMALCIAASATFSGTTQINDTDCIAKSYPNFNSHMQAISPES
ncbi:MAG: 3-phosphoshikimate 1-carboxyvinyltransferase [Coxiellaceae bacterium]|nr:3-phosphoshikimate 1-carboxyvinyltransferase [Coxiellaceae bacterium]